MLKSWHKFTAGVVLLLFVFLTVSVELTHRHVQKCTINQALAIDSSSSPGFSTGSQQNLVCIACVYGMSLLAYQVSQFSLRVDNDFEFAPLIKSSFHVLTSAQYYFLRAPPVSFS